VIVADSSVAVAAALSWHHAHVAALRDLPIGTPLLAHVAVETYSVLTRLPPPVRVSSADANSYVRTTFALPPIALSAEAYDSLLAFAASQSISGGAIYDALVGATAREAGATLLTLDRRAVLTYQILGLDYRLLA
jgi:predicted nucleic acid-binding protein